MSKRSVSTICLLLGLCLCISLRLPPVATGQTTQASGPFTVIPSQTDPAIKSFNDPHMVWLPTTTPRNQLLVFLPGTGGSPRRMPFLETAAQLGYHVINLMYPDTVAAQQACADSNDPNAYITFRLAIIQGGSFGETTRIARADSIENRLAKLLIYLNASQPGKGWSNFLQGSEPNWSNIAVAGQSQGGGHAYVLSKVHQMARVICFGSPKDYSRSFNAPAHGSDSNTKTPLDRYFAFNHTQDAIGLCNHDQQVQILNQIGLNAYGTTDADHPSPQYNHAHIIFTAGQMPDMTEMVRIHNFALNNRTVLSSDGKPICPPVWVYMLTEPVR